jgi:hypothetical protein
MARTKIILERGDFRGFPQCCASCLTFENLGNTRVRSRTFPFLSPGRVELEVPICARCVRRMTWLHRLGIGSWIVVSFVAFMLLEQYQLPKYWSVVISVGVLALLQEYLSGLGRGPVRLQERASGERLTLLFTNQDYARQFEALNPSAQSSVPLIPVL